jgi:hypothetical protein
VYLSRRRTGPGEFKTKSKVGKEHRDHAGRFATTPTFIESGKAGMVRVASLAALCGKILVDAS